MCSQPTLRGSILSQMDLDGINRLVPVAFSVPTPLTVQIVGSCAASIDLRAGLVPAIFVDGADLGRIAPELEEWFELIAESPSRSDWLEPTWAKDRGLGPTHVEAFARRMAYEVAWHETRRISWGGSDGKKFNLNIPPKARLRFDEKSPSVVISTVASSRSVQSYRTGLGELIVVLGPQVKDAGPASFNSSDLRRVPFRRACRAPENDPS